MCNYIDNEFKKLVAKYHPNDIYDLIKDTHCKLLYADLDEETGGCTQTNNRCHTIIVNYNWPVWYQHFVILHEFSHIKLHNGSSTPFFRSIGLDTVVSKMEYEANSLAMKLLIYMQNEEEIFGLTKFQLLDYLGLPRELNIYL
ncbi:ImmA/IrrE family metallo-endopeptidase [Enterococcus sp. AZ103]|uniref:ImmA/IrrE family metallo-endopeptidase n=1 Tax=Enterococcus sp. AZ103 TaxID=2774628 RepID=UPI003F25C6BB